MPQEPLDEETRENQGLPTSLSVVRGEGVVQRPVFEPALQHYSRAMRPGEPQFASAETAARWYAARHRALDHVLAGIASSAWAGHLVLRGSILLKAWYGDAAREPRDLDFVVVPPTWVMEEPRTDRMLEDLAAAAAEVSKADAGSTVRIDAAGAASDEIWTYDRVPGRRLVLPWHADGLPSGSVQLDFVFNERIPHTPEFTRIPARHADHGNAAGHRILAATAAQSLAWKLLWLVTDTYPQGKDLYDAVLLAEAACSPPTCCCAASCRRTRHGPGSASPPRSWTTSTWTRTSSARTTRRFRTASSSCWSVLKAALAPTFAEAAAEPPADGYARRAALLAPAVERLRELVREEGLDAVLSRVSMDRDPLPETLVLLRETIGADACTLEDVAATYVDFTARAYPGSYNYYRRTPEELANAVAKLGETV
ncbi:nucleotidyl transferase AbiEii/AbiGii toxin family protein [Yinghuangia aomiensis]